MKAINSSIGFKARGTTGLGQTSHRARCDRIRSGKSTDLQINRLKRDLSASAGTVESETAKVEGEHVEKEVGDQSIEYVPLDAKQKVILSVTLGTLSPPWKQVAQGSVLCMNLGDGLPESSSGNPLSKEVTLPKVTENLKKAALDPRISGLYLKISPVSCGYAKIIEIRRHIEFFRKSGKFTLAYFEIAGMKEYLLASACEEIYAPSEAYFSLTGVVIENTFLRGVLEKIGVEPQVERIGKFKSAGDQLLRKDMSDAQRLVSETLVNSIYDNFVECISKDKGKSIEEVEELLNGGPYKMNELVDGEWITQCKYLNEIEDMLKVRTGGRSDVFQSVGFAKYSSVPQSIFAGSAKHTIAVVRSSGAISRTSSATSNGISSATFIKSIKSLQKNKSVKAVVLRIDSPGGDALASDLMWNEIRQLSKTKPVVASMVDVAASGGYYMSMACDKIVAEPLTLTGSIGVVTGKFNLEDLYEKVGYNTESVSKGKYAELNLASRGFKEFEEEYFKEGAQKAYESFRDKAAFSRNKTISSMQEVAQGRVWTGKQALSKGLVDEVGGLDKAVEVAKELAGIPKEDAVRFVNINSNKSTSPLLSLLRNSTEIISKTAKVLSTVEKLSQANVGYDAEMTGMAIKDGSKDWHSNNDTFL